MSVSTLTRGKRNAPAADAQERWRALVAESDAAVVVALTVLAAVLRFAAIGHQGFWFDEGNTALLVHQPAGSMLGLIPQSESTPPLYYCLAWIWARVFGFGEAGLRSLSALAGVATVPLVYGAGAKLTSRRAGVIAAALTACNPLLIWYSQEARAYSLLVAFGALALLAFAYARADPTPRSLLAWVVASALAMSTHYYALLLIVPQALWLLARHHRRRPVLIAVGATALVGLALVPLAIAQNRTGHAGWIGAIPLWWRLKQVVPQFLVGFSAPAQHLLERLAEGLAWVALVLLAIRSDPEQRRTGLLVGALAAGGIALNLVLIAGGYDDLITRNVIVLWLPAAITLAAGLAAARARRLGVAATVALCGCGLVAAVSVATTRDYQRPDWRPVAGVLGSRPVAERAILVQHYRDLLPLSLYLPGLRFMPVAGTPVRELDVVSMRAPRVHLCWWGGACNLSGTGAQRSYPIPGFHELWRRRALQFTIVRLLAPRPVTLTPSAVARALTTTALPADELLIQR